MKKIYEKPLMNEHKLKHQICLLDASVNQFGMRTKLVQPSPYDGCVNGDDDGNDEYVVTEAW